MSIFIKTCGEGMPLVLFHGWGFDHRIWHQLTTRLQSSYKLFLVDLPGFGQSCLVPWEQFKATILQELPRQFSVMGWSLGGLYATRLAIEEPQRVSYLLNVASTPRFIREDDWPGLDPTVFLGFMNKLVSHPEKTLKEFVGLQAANYSTESFDCFNPPLESLQHGLSILAEWDLRQALLSVEGKVAYFFGGLDSITSRQTLRVMQKSYPNFHFRLFPKAAHMPFLSHEEDFIAELNGILK